jgi:Lrp/AsnC family leucine-responsive transcriptional regulator
VTVTELAHFEGLIERLGRHGEMRTHIVLSTQFDGRPVERAIDDRPVSQSEGWRRR